MNVKILKNKESTSIGRRLRQARENMGLSQHLVAKKLCLKVSTVKDIENDFINPNLSLTFLRGYIRSYARLVRISEEELITMIAKQVPIKISKIMPIKNFSLTDTYKKYDNWLMKLTWLILSILISLTGVWWWQNHRLQQQDTTSMTNQFSLLSLHNKSNEITLMKQVDDEVSWFSSANETDPIKSSYFLPTNTLSNAANVFVNDSNHLNTLVLIFSDDCWLEVLDDTGKKLFSGTKYKGTKLNLTGQIPYKLRIGAPAATQIYFHGKSINLNRFIQSNQVAKLTVPPIDDQSNLSINLGKNKCVGLPQ
ncbi:cytoskeleton protein RodZ [Sodalis sp. CWE]|uniref:cytoskeleton protein RodZ n=1 Tax=Sodalis sp. CWE TaxID=2803816 RepID=UPI001C7D2D46|nr:cytoskeleton protein RodZ [Sodalis sp. CWE]MBX4181014.1 cytoskeleton protein RodZ [Sodalis sp. CWE]